MCGQALLSSCTVIFVIRFILLNFVSGDRPMDLGLKCLSPCVHKMRPPKKSRLMTTVFAASCVVTVRVMYETPPPPSPPQHPQIHPQIGQLILDSIMAS